MSVLERHPENHRLGWRPQPPDPKGRDFVFRATREARSTAPRVVKNSPSHPHKPYNQKMEGSCVGNGVAAQYAFHRMVAGYRNPLMFSRSFIYYHARKIQGWQKSDTGCYPRDAAKVVNRLGAPIESNWDYSGDPAGKDWVYPAGHRSQKEPTEYVLKNAAIRQVEEYSFVPQSMDAIRAALYMRKPVGFGFLVYQSFYDPRTGAPVIVVKPPVGNEQLYGGHYVVAMDYDDDTQLVRCLNSWGENVQEKGYFYLTYDMLISRHASDFMVLDRIEKTRS